MGWIGMCLLYNLTAKAQSKKVGKVVGVKSYLSKTSVNSEVVFHTIIVEVCGGM